MSDTIEYKHCTCIPGEVCSECRPSAQKCVNCKEADAESPIPGLCAACLESYRAMIAAGDDHCDGCGDCPSCPVRKHGLRFKDIGKDPEGLRPKLEAAEKRVEELEKWKSETREHVLYSRGVEPKNACKKCGGLGTYGYPDTTTWRSGCGGQTITNDVCDKCWGSGDSTKEGANLRRFTGKLRALEFQVEETESFLQDFKVVAGKERDALQLRVEELEPLVKKAMDFIRWGDDDDPCCCITDDGEECVVCMFNRYFKEHPCKDCADKQARIKAAMERLNENEWPNLGLTSQGLKAARDTLKILTDPQTGESQWKGHCYTCVSFTMHANHLVSIGKCSQHDYTIHGEHIACDEYKESPEEG